VRIEDLEIDTAARAVRRGGQVIELTPREYALLEFLAVRQVRSSRAPRYGKHVYEFNDDATSNVVGRVHRPPAAQD